MSLPDIGHSFKRKISILKGTHLELFELILGSCLYLELDTRIEHTHCFVFCDRQNINKSNLEFRLYSHDVAAEAQVILSYVHTAPVVKQAANTLAHQVCHRIGFTLSGLRAQRAAEIIKYFLSIGKCELGPNELNGLRILGRQGQDILKVDICHGV